MTCFDKLRIFIFCCFWVFLPSLSSLPGRSSFWAPTFGHAPGLITSSSCSLICFPATTEAGDSELLVAGSLGYLSLFGPVLSLCVDFLDLSLNPFGVFVCWSGVAWAWVAEEESVWNPFFPLPLHLCVYICIAPFPPIHPWSPGPPASSPCIYSALCSL